MAERLLAHRLVYEAVDINELRHSCTDATQLGQVCLSLSYLYATFPDLMTHCLTTYEGRVVSLLVSGGMLSCLVI